MSLPPRIEMRPQEEHLATFYPRFVFYVGIALLTGSSGLFLVIAAYLVFQSWIREQDNFSIQDCLDAMHDSIAWVFGRRAIHITTDRMIIESAWQEPVGLDLAEISSIELQPKLCGGNLVLHIHGEQPVTVLKVMRPAQLASEIQQACLASGGTCPA